MKYNFVFDKEFLGNSRFELSEEEIHLVRVIVNGGHNVMLRGYKPERIVRAIKAIVSDTTTHIEEPPYTVSLEEFCGGGADLKKGYVSLADNGILIMNDIDEFRASVVEMTVVPMRTGSITLCHGGETVQYPSNFQLIATAKKDWNYGPLDSVAKFCEIDYLCKKDSCRSLVSLSELKNSIHYDWNSHLANNSFTYKNQELMSTDELAFTSEAREIYEGDITSTFNTPFMIAKVARTVADMRGHINIRCADLETARNLFTPQYV